MRTVCECDHVIDRLIAAGGGGRPKLTSKKLTEKDCRQWKKERSTWRSGVRSAMGAASQLPGRGPTDVDDALALAR